MPAPLEVLVVDDDASVRESLRLVLEHAGHAVSEAETGDRALEHLWGRRVDAVLLDINMPGLDGLDTLARIREIAPDTGVIVVTGEATIANAMKAGQRGAYDFIEKPPDRERLLEVLAEAARVTRLRRTTPPAVTGDLGIVGRSGGVAKLIENIRRIAPSQGRVLITGDNGSGKELVAQAIHALSKRSSGPFVKINCAAIPKDLLESELFGYERGAFTGAVQAKKGRIELADLGTLFLDEIGDLSLESQAKLLRVIESGEVERVGGTRTAKVDVRIVSATNKNLSAEIENGDFRQDLFYRLNVLPIHVPPLRERAADIPLLSEHFLAAFCSSEGKPQKRLSAEAIAMLEAYHWPGNVRELKNLMERAAILVEGETVRAEDLAPWLESGTPGEEGVGLRGEIERREAEAIRKALEGAHWNVTQAASGLGIDRTNLHRKMRKYGISRR
jgi:two-component system, NtrC family, nitrogen regulation response regulator NtrX